MGVVRTASKVPLTSNQAKRRRHKANRVRAYHDPGQAYSPNMMKHLAQECFDYEQKQNRGWLHHQILMPGQNGINHWEHDELLRYFLAPTLKERSRPPLLREGLKLSCMSSQHLARLNEERDNAKLEQGMALGMATRAENWWDEKPKEKKLNRKGRKLAAFFEKKQREQEGRAATTAIAIQARREMKKLRLGEEGGEEMDVEEEGEDEEEEEECGVDIGEKEAKPGRWVTEIPFRGLEPFNETEN